MVAKIAFEFRIFLIEFQLIRLNKYFPFAPFGSDFFECDNDLCTYLKKLIEKKLVFIF